MITITHRVLEAFRVRLFSRSLVSDSFNPMGCSMPGFPVLHHLPEFAQIQVGDESVMPSNHPLLSCPLLLPSVFPSSNVFSSELVLCIRWPEYWSFSFSINPSNEYLGLIFFRIDWFNLLAVQGTFESFSMSQFKSINSWHSAFFLVQLSHPYVTIGKTSFDYMGLDRQGNASAF